MFVNKCVNKYGQNINKLPHNKGKMAYNNKKGFYPVYCPYSRDGRALLWRQRRGMLTVVTARCTCSGGSAETRWGVLAAVAAAARQAHGGAGRAFPGQKRRGMLVASGVAGALAATAEAAAMAV